MEEMFKDLWEKFKHSKTAKAVGFILLGILLVLILWNKMVATNDATTYQVKQATITGNMSVRTEAGMYPKMWGKITEYTKTGMNHFSKYDEEGGKGLASAPISVQFNDGGKADISGSIKYKLSLTESDQIELHKDYRSVEAISQDLVRQVVTEALMQTATLMKAEESYSTRRSEFTSVAEAQIIQGIFYTESEEIVTSDAEGNEFTEKITKLKVDEDGNRMVRKASPFVKYHITILQFVVKDIDFDPTIDALIAKKKEAEQQKIVAKSNAERAKQDAITAFEQGEADKATALAKQAVLAIERTTKAKADKDVAETEALAKANVSETQATARLNVAKSNRQAEAENAKAMLITKEAEAKANRLLVQAGLTPEQKAKIDKETKIGVAHELAGIKFPEMMVIGGGDGGALNPFDAVGLESLIKISENMSE
jgi:regulator of protease activity HflC (stomatin/prohibitin superfamily)